MARAKRTIDKDEVDEIIYLKRLSQRLACCLRWINMY